MDSIRYFCFRTASSCRVADFLFFFIMYFFSQQYQMRAKLLFGYACCMLFIPLITIIVQLQQQFLQKQRNFIYFIIFSLPLLPPLTFGLFFLPSIVPPFSLLADFYASYCGNQLYSMKSGKGNKDNDLLDNLRSELEQKKKQNLQLRISLQSLQTHNATLVHEVTKLAQDNNEARSEADNLIDNQKFHISILEDRNKEILLQKRDLQIKHDTLKITYDALSREFSEFKVQKDLEMEGLKKKHEEDLQSFQVAQSKFNNSIFEYERLLKEIGELKSLKENEQEVFKVKIANIEREKIQSIDSIKKEMLNKACQMRNKALEIRKQQLQVTTRLTFLQNDQLIRQLQFQSAKTEEILRKNNHLEDEVKSLKRSIEIHQEVEKELMKRNVGAKNIIANLNQRMKVALQPVVKPKNQAKQLCLQEQGEQNKNDEIRNSVKKIIRNTSGKKVNKSAAKVSKQYEDIQILKEYIKNMQQIQDNQQKQNELFKAECQKLKDQNRGLKTKIISQNCDSVGTLMIRFLQQIIRPLKNSEENESNQNFDLKVLKQVDVQKWSVQNLQKITKIILNELRPYLSLKTLKMPYFQSSVQNNPQNLCEEKINENLRVSKYLQALKRQKDRSIENIKSRSVTYIIEERRQQVSQHRKISTIRNHGVGLLQPVAKRFAKPYLANRI